MKESVAVTKEADKKKEFSSTESGGSILRLRDAPGRQLGSLGCVIGNIRSNGGEPSVGSIATQLSGMPTGARAPALLALQQTHGNRYVQRVVTGIQAKLVVGQPGDIYEQEADRVADAVMQMPEPEVQRQPEEEKKREEEFIQTKPLSDQITPLVQRQVEEEEEKKEEEILQTKVIPDQTPEVSSDLESRIQSLKGGGQPLAESTRAFFEPRFGVDFSNVRIHTDSNAAQLSREFNAQAFTYGRDIYFGSDRYSSGTLLGKRLLAHELTHVLQQSSEQSARRINNTKRPIDVTHGNRNAVNRRLFDSTGNSFADLGQLFSTSDVAILARNRGPTPLEIVDQGGSGPFNDPFRVRLIREIIQSTVEVLLVRVPTVYSNTPHCDLYRNGQRIRANQQRPLRAMGGEGGAGGVHIAARALALRHPNYTGPVSCVANTSYVVYVDPLHLGHELFGHCYLSIKGSPSGHGRAVSATANIRAPDGTQYTGSVDDFINEFAEEVYPSLGQLHFSPTRVLDWPTPNGSVIHVTYLEFTHRYPNAWIVESAGRRLVHFYPGSP